MSPAERKDLSKAEWKVMKIVWELQKAMAREVYTIAGRAVLLDAGHRQNHPQAAG